MIKDQTERKAIVFFDSWGWLAEHANQYIPTKTLEDGWQPTFACGLVFGLVICNHKKEQGHTAILTWHRMPLLSPAVIKQYKLKLGSCFVHVSLSQIAYFLFSVSGECSYSWYISETIRYVWYGNPEKVP